MSIYARIQRRPRSEREVRENYVRSLSGSQAYNPQKETGRNSNASQKATSRQELERFASFRPRPCLRHVWRVTLTRQFAIRQAVSSNATHRFCKPHRIGELLSQRVLPIVESECLLIHVTEQMKRFNGNIGSTKTTLQQAPEILYALYVNLPVNVLLKMVHELPLILAFQSVVARELIRHNFGAGSNKV